MKLPSKKEKREQFKEMVLELLDWEQQKGEVVKVNGGLIDFTHLGQCYMRTARLVLYELRERMEEAPVFDKVAMARVIKSILNDIDKE